MIPKFRIRCSSNGKLLGGTIGISDSEELKKIELDNREKPLTDNMIQDYSTILYKLENPTATTGMKSYCKKWLNEQVFKRRKEIHSKYIDKGNFNEEWSIEFINAHLLEDNVKNEKFFENDFMCGTPDLINQGIDDVKNSYDTSTFPLYEEEIPNKDYIHQLNGYMHLCGKKTGRLIYTLSDLPPHLIEKEARSMSYKEGGHWEDYITQCKAHFTYGDIDPEYKIKIYNLEYDKSIIDELEGRVHLCREYIKERIKSNE